MYPDFTNETNPNQIKPIDEKVEPQKPSVWLLIFVVAFIIWLIVDLILDYINQKELIDIVFDWMLLGLWIFVAVCIVQAWLQYKRVKEIYDWLKDQDAIAKANPAVRIAETFVYFRRSKYYQTRDLTCSEYELMKKRAPKKYARIIASLPEDTKTCEEIRRIIFKDPSILKEVAKHEKEQAKIEDDLMVKYKELLDMSPEERKEVEKKYDSATRSRNYARQYYKKK